MDDQPRPHRAEHGPLAPAPRDAEPVFEEDVDGASEASFPASDPPAWMGMRIGGPPPRPEARPSDRPSEARPDAR